MGEQPAKLSPFGMLHSMLGNMVQKTHFNHGKAQPSGLSSSFKPFWEDRTKEYASDLDRQLCAWRKNTSWVDTPAQIKVTVPKGSLCHLDAAFQLGIPPDAVFNIATDPENRRVFKNIKEVRSRKVLEDDGCRQLVQVEQAAIWKFLWLSGTFTVNVFVDQDRRTRSIKFYLAREGFMKRFEGFWKIKPLLIGPPVSEDGTRCTFQRMASEVHLQQLLQPAVIPPPPLSWYIRSISARTIECMITDLQAEAARLREGHLGQEKLHELELQSMPKNSQKNELFLKGNSEQQQWLVRVCSRSLRKNSRRRRNLSVYMSQAC